MLRDCEKHFVVRERVLHQTESSKLEKRERPMCVCWWYFDGVLHHSAASLDEFAMTSLLAPCKALVDLFLRLGRVEMATTTTKRRVQLSALSRVLLALPIGKKLRSAKAEVAFLLALSNSQLLRDVTWLEANHFLHFSLIAIIKFLMFLWKGFSASAFSRIRSSLISFEKLNARRNALMRFG